MGQLCIYLPPLASDYSGVCSALFDFDCLMAINDPRCCTNHYVYYDEPRWAQRVRPIFSTELRNIDAVLGNDEKIVKTVCEAADALETQMVAVVGTPVPAITGMDMVGIACEIEARTGKNTFGFNTTGYGYYDRGIVAAGKALLERYAVPDLPQQPGSINILGMTPLDFGNVGNEKDLRQVLLDAGWSVQGTFFMDTSLSEVENAGSAEVNLAVSAAGLGLAKYLKARFGTPYIAACPMGKGHLEAVLHQLKYGKEDFSLVDVVHQNPLLIVSDQVMANSLREALRGRGCKEDIAVASFFGWAPEISEPGDTALSSERQLIELLRTGRYKRIAADPLFACIPEVAGMVHHQIVHPAVSSKLKWPDTPKYQSLSFEALLALMA